ncbi:hypothetical protein Acr_26g0004350 [Actinidia rufa]|uniref:Retrotransposon gag domain-containing protein n=1 Tax=Actinidia rufa TaxID=165716 RepID=A0A7J0H2C8_9ERIC|nr:hypothetical protein Acr_26g0004350 [Actinidia rufa]
MVERIRIGGKHRSTGEKLKDPAIPVENVAIVKQFLKLKPPTFSGEMDPVKANEWLLEMEKNFRCKGTRHELGSIQDYEAAFTNLAEYAPHLVATDEMRARRFEDGLRYEIKRVIRPLVLPTYADVLDRAIIVEQDEMEKRKYFDSKKRQNFNNEGSSGQKRQKPESNWRNQRGQIPKCPTCGKNHSGECWKKRPDYRGKIKEEEMPSQKEIVRVIKGIGVAMGITKDKDKCLPLCQAMRGMMKSW